MSFGVDYAFSPHPSVKSIQGAGCTFVCRYTSSLSENDTNGKNLLPAEAKSLLNAGLHIVVVSENGATRMKDGRAAGAVDAAHADAVVKALGMPKMPVYFACDYDAPESDQPQIDAYLDGAAATITRDRVGIYGGFWPLSRARAAGKAKFFWGTIAWSGSNWATNSWWNIMQGLTVSVGGIAVDVDHSRGTDYGQWPRPAVAPPVQPSGPPYRHTAQWWQTPAGIAKARNTTVEHLVEYSAANYTDNDKAIAAGKRLRSGMPYYTSNP